MRWPIRSQILIPFAAMQIVAAIVVSVSSAWLGVQSAEKRVASRLDAVLDTLESSSFPLTPHILNQLSQLSGAQFALLDDAGQTIETTLTSPIDPASTQSIPAVKPSQMESLPIIGCGGEQYFAGFANRRLGPSAGRVLVLYPEQPWRDARWQAAMVPLRWGALVLMFTLLTSLWLARRIARRVQAVQQHVCRIATGDFQPVPASPVDDELRDLSQAVNQMALALMQSMQQIRQSERAAMLAQLASGLAHTLRNALTGARVSIQLHQKHCSEPDDRAIRIALGELQRAEEHIRALLRVSQGRASSSRPGDLSALLEDVALVVTPLCEHHRVDFSFQASPLDRRVHDSEAVRGAILNLVTNAIEAAGPGGRVALEVQPRENDIVVRVTDNGVGIADEHLHEVFAPFFTTKEEGVGIGLPVAKQAAEECGGTLSTARIDGLTIFEFTIPRDTASLPEATPAATTPRRLAHTY